MDEGAADYRKRPKVGRRGAGWTVCGFRRQVSEFVSNSEPGSARGVHQWSKRREQKLTHNEATGIPAGRFPWSLGFDPVDSGRCHRPSGSTN